MSRVSDDVSKKNVQIDNKSAKTGNVAAQVGNKSAKAGKESSQAGNRSVKAGNRSAQTGNKTGEDGSSSVEAYDASAQSTAESNSVKKNDTLKKVIAFLKDFDYYYLLAPACILVLFFVYSAFTGYWPWKANPYNSFTLQANAWLHGTLNLPDGENYAYLELAIFEGDYFVSFPPFPSYVLLPFAFFCGLNTPDGFIVMAFAMIGALYAYRLCKEFLGEDRKESSFLLAMLIYLGSNTLFFTMSSWVWFMAQTMSFTFTILAFFYSAKAKPGWSLAFWAMAVGCRPFQILFLPVLLILMIRTWDKNEKGFSFVKKLKTEWYKGIPCLAIAVSYCMLNYARFGSIIEFGHNYLPEFTREKNGQFSIEYLMSNLGHMFRLPVMTGDEGGNRLNFLNADGIAIWLVNPIFILLIITLIYRIIKVRDMDTYTTILIFVLACVHIVILCMHRTLGGWHFGNRYTCDMLPSVLVGILLSMPKSDKFMVLPRLIFIFGFALNLVGTIAAYNYWI